MTLFSRPPQLMLARSLVRRRRKVLVPAPPTAATCNHQPIVGFLKIVNQLAGVFVINQRSDRNFQNDVFTLGARAIRPLTVPAALRLVLGVEAEVDKRVVLLARFHDDVAAAAAIAARWPSPRNKLLPPEGHAAIPAVPGNYPNFRFIDKH